MPTSSRTVWVAVLGLLGLAGLVGPSIAQQDQQPASKTDPAVRPANTTQTGQSGPSIQPARIATIDIHTVFQESDKYQFLNDDFEQKVQAKTKELEQFAAQLNNANERLANVIPNSDEAKKINEEITRLRVQYTTVQQQAQREFTELEGEMLATMYKDIQYACKHVATHYKFTHIVRVSNVTPTSSNPETIPMALSQSVIYADPSSDITQDVIKLLNNHYRSAGGTPPKPAAATDAAPGNGAPPPGGGPSPATAPRTP